MMNKKDAAAVLQVSIRLVEKYASEGRLGDVLYVRGKTGSNEQENLSFIRTTLT